MTSVKKSETRGLYRSHDKKLVYGQVDTILLHPKMYFSKRRLSRMAPYQIFTGVGFVCTVLDDRLQADTWFFKDKKSLNRFIRQIKDSLHCIEECFYASVVQQNTEDPFQNR